MALTMPPWQHWCSLTTTEYAALDPTAAVVMLPVGAIEQHGPHLSVGVDSTIAQGITAAALANLPAATPLLLLPPLVWGYSLEHAAFAGTLSLQAETFQRVLMDIGASVARSGFRKLLFFNAHGGNPPLIDWALRELRVHHGCLAVTTSWPSLLPPELRALARNPQGVEMDLHGGLLETSIMLYLDPAAVRRDQLQEFPLAATAQGSINPTGAVRFGWTADDLHPSGACGDASRATAALGPRLVAAAAAALAAVIVELSQRPAPGEASA